MSNPATASSLIAPIQTPKPRRQNAGPAALGREVAAELALHVFMEMERAAAIVQADGRLLLTNNAFTELFKGEDAAAALLRVNAEAGRTRLKVTREAKLPDGRTLGFETLPLPEGWLVSAADMTATLARRAREAMQARTDDLTQLGNRLMFQERLQDVLADRGAATNPAAVLAVDLGRFKALNESLGRKIGDALLCLVAKRIRSTLTGGDVVARLEADKFGIIQIGQPQPQSAEALASRLVDLIGRAYLLDGQLINISGCVGVVTLGPDTSDCDEVLKSADLALSRAKSDGHGSYRFFEAAMDEKMRSCRNLEIDLRRALSLREFSLVYQPQLNLKTRRVTGFEALLRWQCPTRGAVSPLDFIPLAEETGVITSIGEWVLRTACHEAARWPNECNVAVNVSAVQFASFSLVTTIMSALAESGLDPRRLELEITESVMLDARGTALSVLQNLRSMGVRVALDDFGTGYSSLGYLRSFPFDKIKIDQTFVRGTANDPAGQAIVRAIAYLGQSLGMETVAEGVETEEQLARITADGCTDVQGYLISRPLPPDQIAGFMTTPPRPAPL
uniref:Diguanylate cyclase/phosphodiesterase n=1 Tax=Rhodopseudomonas palustris (strain BisA53) TaxID=316055 RepID=Q07V94_RHOP5